MKKLFNTLLILALCMVAAGWLRMFHEPVTLLSWKRLWQQPAERWFSHLWVMPVHEAIHYYWGYLLAVGLFLLLTHFFFKRRFKKRTSIKLGLLLGAGGYILVTGILRHFPSLQDGIFLLVVYSLVGALFGYLYHKWVSKPEHHHAHLVAPPLAPDPL